MYADIRRGVTMEADEVGGRAYLESYLQEKEKS